MHLPRRLTAAALGVLMLAALVVPAALAAPTRAPLTVPDLPVGTDGLARAIVAYEGGVVPDGALDLLDDLGVTRGIELASIGAVAVTAPQAVIETLAATDDRLIAVAPQRRLELDLYASKEQIDAVGMDSEEAYRTSRGSGTRPGVTGAGVTVAVLDSGIFEPHPDLAGRVPLGLHYSFSEIQDSGGISYEEWDAYAENTGHLALQDEIGHGTHVASTVGGSGAASAEAGGPDLAGVAPEVEFVSMKVATAPFGIVDDIDWEEAALAAFDYIIRHPELGIRIAQNSWGLLPHEPDCLGAGCGEKTDFDGMAKMIGKVEDAGVTVVFSAGNSGPEPDTIGGYHRADQAILVGAACKSVDSSRCLDDEGEQDQDQVVTDFSSRGAADGSGPQVDVIAPGDNIMAAVSPSVLLPLTECPESQQPGYYCISGTSMASPHVSGVAALMYEANPDLTPDQVESCILGTATDVLAPGVDRDSGHGMVDTRDAVACAHALTLARAGAPSAVPPGVTRLAGEDRLETAVAVARADYPKADSARAVVIARADEFADGLAGTPLAAAMGGPLLLSSSDRLDGVTRAEVERLLPEGGRVLLLGGEAALSSAVAQELEDAGFAVERAGGKDRYETAVTIAKRLEGRVDLTTAIIARGDLFPDALAAGPAATAAGAAILLSESDRPNAATDAWLADHEDVEVVAVGGPAATAYPDARRVAGEDRLATAVAVADAFLADATGMAIARHDGFADALTGGVHAAVHGMPILLTERDRLSATTAAWVDRTPSLDRAVVLGGTAAIGDAVVTDLEQRLR